MLGKNLEVTISSRGCEVYGIKFKKKEIDRDKFILENQTNYFDLSNECEENEVPLKNSDLLIYYDGVEICDVKYNNEKYFDCISVIFIDKDQSYRDLFNANEDEDLVIWFHDSINSFRYNWDNIKNFKPENLKVFVRKRLDETDDSNYYIIDHITYDGFAPDSEDIDVFPKSGYFGLNIV